MNSERRKEIEKWFETRPPLIQELGKKFPPWGKYIMKEGAPYGVSCPGTHVIVDGYTEDGELIIIVPAENKLPEAIAHEARLCDMHGRTEEEKKYIHNSNVQLRVHPDWVEKIEKDER